MTMYLIRKRGAYYRPNAEGYTCNRAEAGRYTLDEAISHSHPNGPNGPRDGIDYFPDTPASEFSASKHEPMSHRCETCGTKDGHHHLCAENVPPDDEALDPGFLIDLASRIHAKTTPAMGFDGADVDRLIEIAGRLAARGAA